MNKKLASLTVLTVLLVSYQNCSMTSQHSASSLVSMKGCDGVLKETYQKTYYPLMRQYCTSCHDANGEAGSGRWFASSDFDDAYSTFMSLGRSKVEAMALNAGHRPPKTGSLHQAAIAAAQPAWQAAEAAVVSCGSQSAIMTNNKALPATVYTAATRPADNAAWPRLTFDLNTELKNSGLNGKIRLTVSLEVRRAIQPGTTTVVGYDFRNARVLVSGTAPLPSYRIRGLKLYMNDSEVQQVTLFDNIDFTASSATETLMLPGVGYTTLNLGGLQAQTDQFAFKFNAIEDGSGNVISPGPSPSPNPSPIPTRVSYADLMSANATLGIFNSKCVSCHNNTRADGGFNLSTYANASAAASLILSRVNNAANPMPPGQLMSPDQRAIVGVWVNGGAPQN